MSYHTQLSVPLTFVLLFWFPYEPGVVAFAFNSRTQEAEAGGALLVQGQPVPCSEFPDSQGYIEISCLKNKINKKINKKIVLLSWFPYESEFGFLVNSQF